MAEFNSFFILVLNPIAKIAANIRKDAVLESKADNKNPLRLKKDISMKENDKDHHEELGFWRQYMFSTDHKIIGIQYGITALFFLLFGFILMMMMRWQVLKVLNVVWS